MLERRRGQKHCKEQVGQAHWVGANIDNKGNARAQDIAITEPVPSPLQERVVALLVF